MTMVGFRMKDVMDRCRTGKEIMTVDGFRMVERQDGYVRGCRTRRKRMSVEGFRMIEGGDGCGEMQS